MADMDAVNKAIRVLIRTLLGMSENSVRKANQNAPTGAKEDQFATVFVASVDHGGWDNQRFQDEASPSTNVLETVIGQRHISASIQFFRGDAYSKAERLKTLLQTSGAVEQMRAVGLGLIKASPARDLTAVVDTFYESRGQIDIEFYFISKESISTPTYEDFSVSVTTPISTQTIEVIQP